MPSSNGFSADKVIGAERNPPGDPLACVKALCERKAPAIQAPSPASGAIDDYVRLVMMAQQYLVLAQRLLNKGYQDKAVFILRFCARCPWSFRDGMCPTWPGDQVSQAAERLVPEFFKKRPPEE